MWEGSLAMSTSIYLVGYFILVVGLALGANLLGVPTSWIIVGVIIMVGIGIMSVANRLRS